jgi:hypothetical protein
MVKGSLRLGAEVPEAVRRGTAALRHTSRICMTAMVRVPATKEIWAPAVAPPTAGSQQWGQTRVLPRQRRRQRPPSDLQPDILASSADGQLSSSKKVFLKRPPGGRGRGNCKTFEITQFFLLSGLI